jgi:hypothetical protein
MKQREQDLLQFLLLCLIRPIEVAIELQQGICSPLCICKAKTDTAF